MCSGELVIVRLCKGIRAPCDPGVSPRRSVGSETPGSFQFLLSVRIRGPKAIDGPFQERDSFPGPLPQQEEGPAIVEHKGIFGVDGVGLDQHLFGGIRIGLGDQGGQIDPSFPAPRVLSDLGAKVPDRFFPPSLPQ